MLTQLAGVGQFRESIAYKQHHSQYPDADLLQAHGAMQLVPSGLPLQDEKIIDRLIDFWKTA